MKKGFSIENELTILATEMMWWVREDKRNSSYGLRLLKAFEQEAINRKANKITLSLLPNSSVQNLESLGYFITETSHTKGI